MRTFSLGPYHSWAELEKTEESFVNGHRAILEQQIGTSFNFLGFLYRGVVLHGSRRQTMVLSNSAILALGKDRESAERFVEHLVGIYLSHYGSVTTINNLILETERELEPTEVAESIHLSFGGNTSYIAKNGMTRSIVVSGPLAASLGIDLDLWSEIRHMVLSAQANELPALKRSIALKLGEAEDRVADAERVLVEHEPAFLFSFGSYVLQQAKPHPVQILELLPTWLRSFQALFMFLGAFGRYWATVPIRPPYASKLQKAGLLVPNSAVTAISNDPIDPDVLKEAAQKINVEYPGNLKAEIETAVSRIAKFVQGRHKEIKSAIKTVYPEWNEENVPLPYKVVPNVCSLLQLAMRLVGAKHEGKQLSFIILCAPEASVLRYHIKAARRPWILRQKQILDPRDFPDIADCAEDKILGAISFSIQANALLLQEPGHALYFRPIAPQFAPDAIVEFVPFESRRLDAFLQGFTTGDPNALAMHIRARDARLYLGGKKVAFSDGNIWETGTGFGEIGGSDSLMQQIGKLPWAAALDDASFRRVQQVCDTVLYVAQRGYGALFFLVWAKEGETPKKSTMAPVWGSANAGPLDDIATETLATFAGLDGETYVDVSTGSYFTRQFLHVPEDEFLDFFVLDPVGNIGLNARLIEAWETAEQSDPTIESIDEVYRFGTRHQKALRITWAYPATTIAITVSSDGPIRLWARGIPVAKFSQ